jgi:hypothetical protein
MFWAFSIFRSQLAALSLFLLRANFSNVASDPPKRISNYPTAGLTAGQIPEIAGNKNALNF